MASLENNKKSNFLVQAGILAAAGFISRIIGLLYRSPLTAIIGDLGNGYYQAAYNLYDHPADFLLQYPVRHF